MNSVIDPRIVADIQAAMTRTDSDLPYERLRTKLIGTIGYDLFRSHQEQAFAKVIAAARPNVIQDPCGDEWGVWGTPIRDVSNEVVGGPVEPRWMDWTLYVLHTGRATRTRQDAFDYVAMLSDASGRYWTFEARARHQ